MISEDLMRRLVVSHNDEVAALVTSDDPWIVSRDMASVLTGLVHHLKPASVLEFGAGRSSLVLATALERNGGGRLTSIEHQPAYAEAAWKEIARLPRVDATLVRATLGRRASKQGLLYEYRGADYAMGTRGPFDLVFIDAPPGPLGRDSTLFRAAPYMTPGALAVLDDAARPREQAAVRRWVRGLNVELVVNVPDIARGVAVLRMKQPGAALFSPRTFAGTIQDRVLDLLNARVFNRA